VQIERFFWTEHAEFRRGQRRLDRSDIEQAIADGHAGRQPNDGRADWLISGRTPAGVAFEAVYDHPHGKDQGAARIVSVWRLET
jgi:hypothetical protein